MSKVKSSLIFIVLFAVACVGNSQQLYPYTVPILKEYPFFDASFIQEKKVKNITTKVLYKWPNQPLRNSYETQEFEFDQLGNLVKYRTCGKNGVCENTSYFFSKKGKLASAHFRKGTANEIHSYHYDDEGLLLKKEKNNAGDASFISKEEFTYEKYSENQYKKFYLNDEGLTYKYEVVDSDDQGRMIDSRSRFIHGVHRSTIHLEYVHGVLVEFVTNTKDHTRREEKYIMEYDASQRLEVTELWVDAALLYHYEYLYEDGLLEAVLRKNIRTQEIQITKLEYTFFGGQKE